MTSTILRDKTKGSNPDTEFDGYYAIKVNSVTCSCGKVMDYVEVDYHHIIVVWEDIDDEHLLNTAADLKKQGLNPRVVEYSANLGRCIEFYDALKKGLFSDE